MSLCIPNSMYPKIESSLRAFTLFALSIRIILRVVFHIHSCLKWPLGEIYNLIFEHLTFSAILVPNWST